MALFHSQTQGHIVNSNTIQTNFVMDANTMNPDQTAPQEQSDLGSYVLQYRLPMRVSAGYNSRKTKLLLTLSFI